MENWLGILIVIGYLLWEVFSRVLSWRPEVKEPEEEDKKLDELFGEPEPEGVEPQQKPQTSPLQREEQREQPDQPAKQSPPPPVREKSPDQELAEALGLPVGMFQEKPQPPPQKKMPPVRPPAVPAQAQTQAPTTSQPNYWEQQLAQQKEQRRRQQSNSRERDLAKRFEQQAQKKKQPATASTAGDLTGLPALLRSPASARQAIVLREVLGPAPGLAPAGQPRESNTPFI